MLMLERLIQHFVDKGAKFETMSEYVDRWKQANPVEVWLKANPDLSGELAINP